MKKRLLLIVFAILFLASCQANPDEAAVAGKGGDSLKNLITATPGSQNQLDGIPAELKQTFSSGDNRISVNIDASVTAPDINNIPVAGLTPRGLTKSEIDNAVKTLMQGKQLYAPRTLQDYSKDEIADIIIKLKSGQGSDLYAIDPQEYNKEIQPEIDKYQELYKTAPDVSVRKAVDTTLDKDDSGAAILSVTADLGKSIPASFSYIDKDAQLVRIKFFNVVGQPPTGTATGDLNAPGITITASEAQQAAEDVVSRMGLGDFSVNGVGTMPSMGTKDILDYPDYDALPKCFVFYFTRVMNGLNETYVAPQYVQAFSQSKQYNFVWPCEVVTVTVDDIGILSVLYTGPSPDNLNIINSNTQIKTFDEIMEVFKKQILIQGAYPKSEDIIETKINIDSIVFGGTKIVDKDHPGQYLFVPTWDFFGSVTSKYKPGTGDTGQLDENNEFTNYAYGYSIMTINAIDGSVIDRGQGY